MGKDFVLVFTGSGVVVVFPFDGRFVAVFFFFFFFF